MYGHETHQVRIGELRREAAAYRLAKQARRSAAQRRAQEEHEGRVRWLARWGRAA